MRIISFSAKNYRSISTAYKLPLSNFSVIVGPNNEGKSNILKGLGLALNVLTGSRVHRYGRITNMFRASAPSSRIDRFDYNWERDFPINLQTTSPNGCSEFVCEFELDEEERKEFNKKTKFNLNTNLKAKITIGNEEIKFDYLLKGKGKASLNSKRVEITGFLHEKLILQYIPAVRTSSLAINIVENLLDKELSKLENNGEYKEVIKIINRLQQPILKKISKSLKESISNFIPDVKNVTIKNRENIGRLISTSCRVHIDDGTETDLELKGDGVISLTAISLLQHFSKQGSLEKGLILLLEEPESHLHPKAIHNLKKVLSDISNTNQVILTTHSPIIVDRINIKQNIIIQNGKAAPAKNITEIRESLGITMSDNLSSAFIVILVEGEEDIILLKPWLTERSNEIKEAIENGVIIFDHLGGASNIGYKTSLYKNNLCNVISYIDDDEAGRKGINEAVNKGILKQSEYVLSSVRGMANAEIEDLIDLNVYKQLVLDEYGVNLDIPAFKTNKQQWSNRVKELFRLNGKLWNDKLESEIKFKVNNKAAEYAATSINEHKTNSIVSLQTSIEILLQKKKAL